MARSASFSLSLTSRHSGFSLAQNYLGGKVYSAILLVAGLSLIGYHVFAEIRRRQALKRNMAAAGLAGNGAASTGAPPGVSEQPSWRQPSEPTANYHHDSERGLEGDDGPPKQSAGIGLMPVSPLASGTGSVPARSNRLDLGSVQQPREFM